MLVTGAKGFVGKNLCAQLNNIKEGKDRTRPDLNIDAVYEYGIDSTLYLKKAFVRSLFFVTYLDI